MYYKPFLLSILSLALLSTNISAQETDTLLNEIAPVEIRAHFNSQAMLELSTSARVLPQKLLQAQSPVSFLSAINTTPGVRMEERSPGSYRLALRGSMIRSPFGIRNTKIYLDEVPLTDASGNTYLNLIDPVGLRAIHVVKGPDGSLYGPNTGGVVHLVPHGIGGAKEEKSLMLSGGSYGLFHEQLQYHTQVNENYSFSFDHAFLRSDGYREHTAMDKLYFQTAHQWQYNPRGELKIIGLYSDLGYQTPGGLTPEQYAEDPRQARPAGGHMPGAVEQQAGIYNKTILGGITHRYALNDKLNHTLSIFGSTTELENPFITNYEERRERNLGFRTYLSYTPLTEENFSLEMQLGGEGQKGWYRVQNYENQGGTPGALDEDDKLKNGQQFYFYRLNARLYQRLSAEASIGLNRNQIAFDRQLPGQDENSGDMDFGTSWMPRFGLSYQIHSDFALRGSVSRGYSTPSIAEVRSSDNRINRELRAETGTNYELGFRLETYSRRLIADLSAYSFRMNDGIIRQLNAQGNEFFVNAGKMDQKGVEASILAQLVSAPDNTVLQGLIVSGNLSYQDYAFLSYRDEDNDYSGNKVTSVPDWILANTLALQFVSGIDLNILHNYTSTIPLNDANTVSSTAYHLLQAKASWTGTVFRKHNIQLFIGVDNLLDERYSLGNDINAMGERFFNAAAPRNFYSGLKLML